MLIAYLDRVSTCWTITLEGVTRLPTHTLLPLPFAADAPWTVVATHVHRTFPGATVYFNGSQV
jgi:hypothetical protein